MFSAAERDELRVSFNLHRLAKRKERPDLVALERFHTRDWHNLSLPQRKQILAILLNRRARRARDAVMARQQLQLL